VQLVLEHVELALQEGDAVIDLCNLVVLLLDCLSQMAGVVALSLLGWWRELLA
jgi:hypothetical protein